MEIIQSITDAVRAVNELRAKNGYGEISLEMLLVYGNMRLPGDVVEMGGNGFVVRWDSGRLTIVPPWPPRPRCPLTGQLFNENGEQIDRCEHDFGPIEGHEIEQCAWCAFSRPTGEGARGDEGPAASPGHDPEARDEGDVR